MEFDANLLLIVKNDLYLVGHAFDQLLTQIGENAIASLGDMGITLADTAQDRDIVRMYTTWLYRRRNEDDSAMPRMLQYAIHNRLFSEKAKAVSE